MQVTIQFEAQARRLAGCSRMSLELPQSTSVTDCIRQVAKTQGDPLDRILLDQDGAVQSALLVFLNDCQVPRDQVPELADGDVLTLMTPISGG